MADRARRELGVASRGVVADIEKKLAVLDGELARYEELLSERERLRAARSALLGESPQQRAESPRRTSRCTSGSTLVRVRGRSRRASGCR
jgi:hypothetical protein